MREKTMAANEKDEILTLNEVAKYLRVHPTTLYRLLEKPGFPGFRVGSDWRFKRSAIDAWVDAQRKDVAAQRKQSR